jgi:hypothetical protein
MGNWKGEMERNRKKSEERRREGRIHRKLKIEMDWNDENESTK